MDDTVQTLLKRLPKIDEILLILEREGVLKKAPRNFILQACRFTVGEMRKIIVSAGKQGEGITFDTSADGAAKAVKEKVEKLCSYKLCRVINATGVILHTNLGRAPLCEAALNRIVEINKGYCNLEYDLETGKRGLRYDSVRDILCAVSGAEDAIVVNNNAAAVLLVLNTLSAGKEAIVSRGELIEIGGEFRIPDVMEKSGAILCEVGTTNRTHRSDYEKAITENTGIVLKVHTSNFRIAGFTEEVELPTLVELAKHTAIPLMNDLGSGCFIELARYGFEREPTVQEALSIGADVVTFSGDKLLGGPQSGIILGKKDIMERIKKNPLNRALRIDKLTLAALEATMKHYLNPEEAISRINGLRSLTESADVIEKKAKKLLKMLNKSAFTGFTFSLRRGFAMSGGGALPTQEIPSTLLVVNSRHMSASTLGEKLRKLPIPIIARIADDEVLFDVRTINQSEFALIETGLKEIDTVPV